MTSGMKRVAWVSSMAHRAQPSGGVIDCLPLCARVGGGHCGCEGTPCRPPQGHLQAGDGTWLSKELVQKHEIILPHKWGYSFPLIGMGTE